MIRSIPALAAALVLVGAMAPAPVSAAAPYRASQTQTGILCEFSTAAGDVVLQWQSYDGEMFAGITMWAPDAGPDDAPVIASYDGTASFDGTTIEATFELGTIPSDESQPERVGSARMTATLTAAGPEEPFDSRLIRDGNRRITLEQTSQLLTVSGRAAISLLSGTSVSLNLETCGGGTFSQSMFATNPNAYLTATEQLYVKCTWNTELGAVGLLAIVDDVERLTQVVVQQGDRFVLGIAEPMLSEDAFRAPYELFDFGTGETVGSAVADADLAGSGERITDVDWFDPYRFSVIGERLTVVGTLTLDLEGSTLPLTMDDASCEAGDVRVQVMEKMPRR